MEQQLISAISIQEGHCEDDWREIGTLKHEAHYRSTWYVCERCGWRREIMIDEEGLNPIKRFYPPTEDLVGFSTWVTTSELRVLTPEIRYDPEPVEKDTRKVKVYLAQEYIGILYKGKEKSGWSSSADIAKYVSRWTPKRATKGKLQQIKMSIRLAAVAATKFDLSKIPSSGDPCHVMKSGKKSNASIEEVLADWKQRLREDERHGNSQSADPSRQESSKRVEPSIEDAERWDQLRRQSRRLDYMQDSTPSDTLLLDAARVILGASYHVCRLEDHLYRELKKELNEKLARYNDILKEIDNRDKERKKEGKSPFRTSPGWKRIVREYRKLRSDDLKEDFMKRRRRSNFQGLTKAKEIFELKFRELGQEYAESYPQIMLNFAALDFETANHSRSSICQVGIVVVRNNRIVETYETLVNPGDVEFSVWNVKVHGIRRQDVQSKPNLVQILPKLWTLLCRDGYPIISYSTFDKTSLFSALGEISKADVQHIPDFCSDIYEREVPWLDLHKVIKSLVDELPRYRLRDVVQYFGLGEYDAHNALADARAASDVCSSLSKKFRVDMQDMLMLSEGRISPE